MATTTQSVAAKKTRTPLALWHLLSLDAPTVAVLWTWFVARATHIRLPITALAAMALAVWTLYAADRLLDARLLDARLLDTAPRLALQAAELEVRHIFHHRHRHAFLIGIALAALALAALLSALDTVALHLYLTEGVLLFAWFLILHATSSAHRLPKELAVGLFFAAATFIPTVSRDPFAHSSTLRLALLPDAVLFAALCSLNCLFIYAWEHTSPARSRSPQPHATTRIALRHLTPLAVAVAGASAALAVLDPFAPKSIPVACALSSALLLILDRHRHRLPEVTLRAAADLALLTPLALLPFTR